MKEKLSAGTIAFRQIQKRSLLAVYGHSFWWLFLSRRYTYKPFSLIYDPLRGGLGTNPTWGFTIFWSIISRDSINCEEHYLTKVEKTQKKRSKKKTLKTTGDVENIVKFKSNKFEIELPTKLSVGTLSMLCLWVDNSGSKLYQHACILFSRVDQFSSIEFGHHWWSVKPKQHSSWLTHRCTQIMPV